MSASKQKFSEIISHHFYLEMWKCLSVQREVWSDIAKFLHNYPYTSHTYLKSKCTFPRIVSAVHIIWTSNSRFVKEMENIKYDVDWKSHLFILELVPCK